MTVITAQERRRRWSDEERVPVLAEIAEPGAVVAEVARRADVCTSLVYRWRREARKAPDATGFAPVRIEGVAPRSTDTATKPPAREPGVIVVEVKEARVRICADAPSALIAATLKALRS